MNLLNNRFSLSNCLSIRCPELFSTSRSSDGKSSFIKFNKFLANRFFISEIWKDFFQKRIKRFAYKSPRDLIFKRFFSFVKTTKTAESRFNPIKHWRFSIIQLKYDFINAVRSILRLISANCKITFGVNEPCHINKIMLRRLNRINNLELCNIFNRYQIGFSMLMFKFFNNLKFFVFGRSVKKRNKQVAFLFLLNKIRGKLLSKIISFNALFCEIINGFLNRSFFKISSDSTTEIFKNIFYNNKVCRRNNEIRSEFFTFIQIGDRKTSIAVRVSRKIKQIFFGIHNLYSKIFKSLKQQKLSDNPTNVVRTDIDGVAQTLQGNDGEFIEKFMEGKDAFGTAPIRDSYICMSHTDMIGQFENVAGFINKAQYPNPNGTKNLAEWGSVGNIRIFTSSRGSITANASALDNDVYNNFIAAQEAYSCTEIDGSSLTIAYHGPGEQNDPCHLRSTMGYRFTFGTCIDQDLWMINLRATLA
jgi:hypothetical protein